MTDLTTYQQQLPDNIEDLSKFVLIGQEKLVSLKAEIRAIKKLELAKEVHEQKLEEQVRLSALVLEAKTQIGEVTKAIPKATNGGANQYGAKATAVSQEQKTKMEQIKDLGFSPKQVERFEKLAENRDLVEQVKAEALDTNTAATQSKVINLAEARAKRNHEEFVQIDRDFDNLKLFRNTVQFHDLFKLENNFDEIIASVVAVADDFTGIIDAIDEQISILSGIKQRLILKKGEANAKKK